MIVFSKRSCPFCTRTKNLLEQRGVPFRAIELDTVPGGIAMHQVLKKVSRQNTVPNIYIGAKHVGGNSDLEYEAQNGKLKKRLDENGIPNKF